MFKKKLVFFVSIFLVTSMLVLTAGCGKQTQNTTSTTNTTSTFNATGSDSALPIVKDKITLKMLAPEWSNIKVGNDMPVYQELEKRTNIHLEFQLIPSDAKLGLEKFNLIMASGDLPDIIGYGGDLDSRNAIIKYGSQGAIIPLQDLIKQYAPAITKALESPLAGDKLPYTMNNWAELTAADGNMYSVPGISSSNAIGAVYAIRSDWLAKVGMKVPETLDDLYNALKAFKEKDPNGKGDELPFVAGQGGKTNTILPLINAFGAHMNLYVSKDDTIKYGPVEPQYKEGLAFLNKLYKEGLLESDYLTSTSDQWKAKASGNQAGFMFVWPASGIGATNAALAKLDPSFQFEPIAPVKGANGEQYKDTYSAGNYLFYRSSITKSNKYPVETMKYLNYCYSEEGTLLTSYGIEGVHHTMVEGKPVYTEKILKNPDGLDAETARIKDGINWTTLPYQIGWDSNFQAMQSTVPMTVKAWTLYREPGMVEAPFPTLKFNDEDTSTKNQYITEIDTYKDAMIDKFIMGIEPLDKFDEFVSQINKSGLSNLLKIMNDNYTNYKRLGNK